jgi:exodeoxyribonuclease VII small subunit
MASKKSTEADPKGYVEALREVEGIIQEIDSNNVDIDILAARIKRAAFLINWCNERIDATEVVVEEIVADIRPAEFDDDSDSSEEDDDDFDEDDDDDDDDDDDFDEDDE